MKILVVRILSFVTILACASWFIWPGGNWKFNWAPLLAFIIAIIAYLELEKHSHSSVNRKIQATPSQADIEQYNQLVTLLPSAGLVRFYKEHDFLGSLDKKYVDPLYEYVELWDTPEREFIDEELEVARKMLYDSASNLALMIANRTVPNRQGRISVKSDEFAGKPTPEFVKKDAQAINELAPLFVSEHEKFVRTARKKLFG